MQQLLYACFILFHLILFLFTGYKASFLNVTIILMIAVSFHLGIWLGNFRREAFMRGRRWEYALPSFATPVLFLLYLAARYEISLRILSSLAEGRIQEVMLAAAVARYSGESDTSALSQIATAIFFMLAIFMGIDFSRKLSIARKLALWAMAIVTLFIQGSDLSRASLILALLLGFTFFTFNRREQLYAKGTAWAARTLAAAIAVIAAVFVFAQYGRVYQEADAWGIVKDRAENLFLGGHYAFLAWLDMPKFGGHVFGSGMFAFVNKMFGMEFVQGNFDQIELPMGFTNIFLWYRGAMEDFSYAFVIFPILCGYSVYSLGSRSPSRLEVLLTMFGVQLILYPFYSPLYFTVFAVPFIVAVLFLPSRREPFLEPRGV